MSELHFDAEGEPARRALGQQEKIRWRRFRNPGMRGAPEVVHEKDGSPLYTTTDITYVEFRARVDGAPGRYRGDQVDATRRVIPNATPFYVTINETPRNGNAAGVADDRDLIREVVRANVEMTGMMSDHFGGGGGSAAEHDAGRRRGLLACTMMARADARRRPGWRPRSTTGTTGARDDRRRQASDLVQVFQQVAPMIQMYIATKVGGGKADDKDEPAPRGSKPSPGATPTSSPPSAPWIRGQRPSPPRRRRATPPRRSHLRRWRTWWRCRRGSRRTRRAPRRPPRCGCRPTRGRSGWPSCALGRSTTPPR